MLDNENKNRYREDKTIDEDIEYIFDNKKLNKSIRKAKRKTNFKITITSIIVFIVVFILGNILNNRISLKYSIKSFESNKAFVELSTPNGYISQSNDTFGLLGGSGTYKITKNIGGKPVILADRESKFGIMQPMSYNRSMGGGLGNNGGEWPVSLWDNGYKRMRFFHPDLQYKEYQNDLDKIDKIPEGKIIELAISFDKPYKINDMFMIQNRLKPANINITWLWLDEFTKSNMEKYQFEIDQFDNKAAGIQDMDTVGISNFNSSGIAENQYNQLYDELLENLNKSPMINHKELYNEIMVRGKTKAKDAKVLGIVVQGTKEELKKLVGNPMIKASTFGVIVDELY